MSIWYRIHGLTVRSDVPLSATRAADEGRQPDVEIRRAGVGEIGEGPPAGRLIAEELDPPHSFFISETAKGFVVRYGHACDLLVAGDGGQIGVVVDPRSGDELASVILSAGGLAFAAARRRHVLFHASGVALDGRAVITLGHAGSGKTTVAAELALAGAAVLADDAIRADIDGADVIVFPGSPTLRLRERSAERLRPYVDPAALAAPTADGRIPLSVGGPPPASVRLAAVLIACPVDDRSDVELEPLGRREALMEAVTHIRTAGYLDGTYLVDHFSFSSELVARVPFYRLLRPPHALPPATMRALVEGALG